MREKALTLGSLAHAELWEPGDAVRISPIPLAAPSTVPLAGGSRFDRLRQGARPAAHCTPLAAGRSVPEDTANA